MAAIRATLEVSVARFLARHASLYPEGYAEIALTPLVVVSPEIGLRALESLLECIGGGEYPPRRAALTRLFDTLRGSGRVQARTLAGCRIIPGGDRLLIVREAGRCEPLAVSEGDTVIWDGRFRLRLKGVRNRKPRRLKIAPLGDAGWSMLAKESDFSGPMGLPPAARAALPAIWAGRSLVEVPHLGYRKRRIPAGNLCIDVRFFPKNPATSAVFPVV